MEVLFFYTVFVVVITVWAKAWGRNGLCYFLLAVICPLIAGLTLLVQGKSAEKKAEQMLLVETALANHRLALENKRIELAQRGI